MVRRRRFPKEFGFVILTVLATAVPVRALTPTCREMLAAVIALKVDYGRKIAVLPLERSHDFNFTFVVGTPRFVETKVSDEDVLNQVAANLDQMLISISEHFDGPTGEEVRQLIRNAFAAEVLDDTTSALESKLWVGDHAATAEDTLKGPQIHLHPAVAQTQLFRRLLFVRAMMEYGLAHDAFVAMTPSVAQVFTSPLAPEEKVGAFDVSDFDAARRASVLSSLFPIAIQKLIVDRIPIDIWGKDLALIKDELLHAAAVQRIAELKTMSFHEFVTTRTNLGVEGWNICSTEAQLFWELILFMKADVLRSVAPKERDPHAQLTRKKPA